MHMARMVPGSTHPGRCPYKYATDAERRFPALVVGIQPFNTRRASIRDASPRNSKRSTEGDIAWKYRHRVVE